MNIINTDKIKEYHDIFFINLPLFQLLFSFSFLFLFRFFFGGGPPLGPPNEKGNQITIFFRRQNVLMELLPKLRQINYNIR